MAVSPAELRRRARKIKFLLMDVDGVLTDGRIYYLPRPNGEMFETKTFHSRDGFGLRLAREAGLKTGIISGRGSPVVEYRARELRIQYVKQRALEKGGPYQRILRAPKLPDGEGSLCAAGILD